MKAVFVLLFSLFLYSAKADNVVYSGSTPAGAVVREFLSIPLADSIDFIRWKLTLQENQYMLLCNYGIGQPNTNGFVQGGYWVEQKGACKKEKNFYYLLNGNKTLSVFLVSTNLFHIAGTDNKLLVGNSGWSYTLSRIDPVVSAGSNVAAKLEALPDSSVFQGRTPCLGYDNQQSKVCYKLKWLMTLFTDKQSGKPTTSYIKGTFFQHNKKPGTWSIITEKDGKIIYRIHAENAPPFYLLRLDENIMVFTDAEGVPLIGNEDFSFTLNRVL